MNDRILAAFAILALSGPSALAADAVILDSPVAAVPVVPVAPPVQVWSGPYAGAFVGYNTSSFDQSGGAEFDGDGVVGGVYGGYNVQSGDLVYGIEGDVGASGVDASGFNAEADEAVDAEGNAFGSLRGRVGVVADPFMVFATGGVAVAETELELDGVSDSQTSVGYTVGGGVEAQITDNVTSRLEYRYSDFDEETYDLGDTSVSSGFDEHSIRAGVALKF